MSDEMEGKGVCNFPDGRVYVGEWVRSRMHGKGQMTWPDGRVYTGEYIDACMTGQGLCVWPTGQRYDGQWLKNQHHGQGTFQETSTSNARTGEWVRGRRLRWTDGSASSAASSPDPSGGVNSST